MAHTYDMPNITQAELEQLVRHNAACVAEPKQTMIGEHGPHAHRACMQDAFMAQVAERGMTVDDLDLLADKDIPQDRKG